jgi:hypothetical protein
MKNIEVILTNDELKESIAAADERQNESVGKGRKASAGLDQAASDSEYGRQLNIKGAFAERAVAKLLDKDWSTRLNTFHGPDVGKRIQVRYSSKAWGPLIVRPADGIPYRYVLVVGEAPHLTVVGWCWGREAQEDMLGEWKRPDPRRDLCLCVDQEKLHGFDV